MHLGVYNDFLKILMFLIKFLDSVKFYEFGLKRREEHLSLREH